jgi:hypothetical protein
MLQKREQVPKCGSNEEGKNYTLLAHLNTTKLLISTAIMNWFVFDDYHLLGDDAVWLL